MDAAPECHEVPRCDLVKTPNHRLCNVCVALLDNRKLRMRRARHARYVATMREEQRGSQG